MHSGNPGPVQIAEGLAAKIMRRAPSPISTQPLIFVFRLFAVSLRILLQRTRTEMPRIHVPHLKLSKRRKKWGRHVGITEWLLVWLIANALFFVWRVLVVSKRKLAIYQSAEKALDDLFSTSPRGRLGP